MLRSLKALRAFPISSYRSAQIPSVLKVQSRTAFQFSKRSEKISDSIPQHHQVEGSGAHFYACNVPGFLHGRLTRMGITHFTPVQEKALPMLLSNLDASVPDSIIHSETGSGKTLTYLLPIFARLPLDRLSHLFTVGIVVVPTYDLAVQVSEVCYSLARAAAERSKANGVRVLRVVGAIPHAELQALKTQPPHVLVCTPQTLLTLLDGGYLNLRDLRSVVFDEADELLAGPACAAVTAIAAHARRHGNRPGISAVSATASFSLDRFFSEALRRRAFAVDLTQRTLTLPSGTQHLCLRAPGEHLRFAAVAALLRALRARQTLVFVDSFETERRLSGFLRLKGFQSVSLRASTQRKRAVRNNRKALHRTNDKLGIIKRNGREDEEFEEERKRRIAEALSLPVVIANERSARGMDLPNLETVILTRVPAVARDYVHMAGRVNRAGSTSLLQLKRSTNAGDGSGGVHLPGNGRFRAFTLLENAQELDQLKNFCEETGVALTEASLHDGELVEGKSIVQAAPSLEAHAQRSLRKLRAVVKSVQKEKEADEDVLEIAEPIPVTPQLVRASRALKNAMRSTGVVEPKIIGTSLGQVKRLTEEVLKKNAKALALEDQKVLREHTRVIDEREEQFQLKKEERLMKPRKKQKVDIF